MVMDENTRSQIRTMQNQRRTENDVKGTGVNTLDTSAVISPYTPRDIGTTSAPSWGDAYRGLIGAGGRGGGAGPQPEALGYQTITPGTVSFSPVQGTTVNWAWQNAPATMQPGPGGGGGSGGGGGGAGAGGGWDVSTVDFSQYGIDPTSGNVASMDPSQMAAFSDQYGNFLGGMYGRMNDYMNNPVGYTPEELSTMRATGSDKIARETQMANESLTQQMNQYGLLGGGTEFGQRKQLAGEQLDRLAQMRNEITLQDMGLRRAGAAEAMQAGINFAGQQGQLENQMSALNAQIQQNDREMEFATRTGNAERANQLRLANQALYAQGDQLNQSAQNEAMLTRNQLATQRAIASGQNRTQLNIANMGNALSRELAMNQMGYDVARQNALLGQEANLFSAGQQANIGQFNVGNQLQASLANQGQDWQTQMFNANRLDAYNRARAAAGNASRNWDRNIQLQGVGADIEQQRYNDQLMLNMLGMQNQGQQNLWNMAGNYAGQVYGSNPMAYVDPYAGIY